MNRLFRIGLLGALAVVAAGDSVHREDFHGPGPVAYAYAVVADPSQPLEPLAEQEGVSWPPARLRLLALKEEKILEVWVANPDGPFRRIVTYAITAASGEAGPKRQEGDFQVPEGFYRLTDLNPNSRFHLSIRVAYPNALDIANSDLPRREKGGDIMVHGSAVSIGCIAIGDEAIEKVYDLVSQVSKRNREIWIAPVDFRLRPGFRLDGEEKWVDRLYENLEVKLQDLPLNQRPLEFRGSPERDQSTG